MRIVLEVLLDEGQLTEEEVRMIEERLLFDAQSSVANVFWYREGKSVDFEITSEITT